MHTLRITFLRYSYAATLMLLAACGTMPGERAVSGAALGAGAGAAIGAVTGGSPGTGAAIGALAGGAVGGLTDPCTLNLGDPAWRNVSRREYERRCGRRR